MTFKESNLKARRLEKNLFNAIDEADSKSKIEKMHTATQELNDERLYLSTLLEQNHYLEHVVFPSLNAHFSYVRNVTRKGPITRERGPVLHEAIYKGYKECAQILIEAKADVNAMNRSLDGYPTPLMNAAAKGWADIVNLLLIAKADVNYKMNTSTALTIAMDGGHRDCINVILSAKKSLLDNKPGFFKRCLGWCSLTKSEIEPSNNSSKYDAKRGGF